MSDAAANVVGEAPAPEDPPSKPGEESEPPPHSSPSEPTSRFLELIRQEWPELVEASVRALAADREALTDHIAQQFESTRVLTRRKLAELERVALDDASDAGTGDEGHPWQSLLADLVGKSAQVSEYVENRLAEDARRHVRANPLTSLVLAGIVGILIGVLLRGPGRVKR